MTPLGTRVDGSELSTGPSGLMTHLGTRVDMSELSTGPYGLMTKTLGTGVDGSEL